MTEGSLGMEGREGRKKNDSLTVIYWNDQIQKKNMLNVAFIFYNFHNKFHIFQCHKTAQICHLMDL